MPLGESADLYRPHQTVRTLANATHPTRRDVKTAVSVRNTLVYRGLATWWYEWIPPCDADTARKTIARGPLRID